MKATIFDIQRNSYEDGPGIRTTVFFKGCNLNCKWCHNPESKSPLPQIMFYKSKCTNCKKCYEVCPNKLKACELCGKCTLLCPYNAREICGRVYTIEELLKEICKDKSFYDSSGGGVTFSGGECMLQIDFLKEILEQCKTRGIHTAIDTAGCVPYESFINVLPYTDLFLYDIKCFDSKKHKTYTGKGNELILDNLKKLLLTNAPVYIRIPVIPGVNDTEEEMQKIKEFLYSNGTPEKIELLPYHNMGYSKYDALNIKKTIFDVPTEDKMNKLKNILKKE